MVQISCDKNKAGAVMSMMSVSSIVMQLSVRTSHQSVVSPTAVSRGPRGEGHLSRAADTDIKQEEFLSTYYCFLEGSSSHSSEHWIRPVHFRLEKVLIVDTSDNSR